ncbi:MAG: hypothetical protein CL680_16820 [Blastomonas sp.]|nr:hypothetical protein [Blastomonas sp.]MAF63105.1 hypothetical protein [Blastomonas sp.]MBA4778545.1 hypothetical protein [Blastomonas sp.]
MMSDRYWLTPDQARRFRLIGALFLVAALVMLPVIVFAGLTPGASPYCGGEGCLWVSKPASLLSQEIRLQVEATAETRAVFAAYVDRSEVRLGLAAIEAVVSVPYALLLACVGLALRRLGGPTDAALVEALRWLKRASGAAVVWALASPVHETLLESFLSPGTPTGPVFQIVVNLAYLATPLLLALAAYSVTWAIETALRKQHELDGFV